MALNWRIFKLTQMDVIKRIGRGRFVIEERKNYSPEINLKMKKIFSLINKEFPYINVCIWNTFILNEFMRHQSNRNFVLVEVEKEAKESIFYFLKELKYSVFIDPTNDIMEKYLPIDKDIFIIKSLTSESPLQYVSGIKSITVEKMLVDIFCDEIIFSFIKGSELRYIFEAATSKYIINENKIFRYANRRGKKKSFIHFYNSLNNRQTQIGLPSN